MVLFIFNGSNRTKKLQMTNSRLKRTAIKKS